MPPHKPSLKVGIPVMLLRNIDQSASLCNETRLRITYTGKNFIRPITLNGRSTGDQVLIHRMDMNLLETTLLFKMVKRQFPFIISFAMTINKSQGQSLTKVDLYLSRSVFTHGQLHVALSRVKNMDGLKILVLNSDSKPTNVT
ncbi:ATP-dependent DNA helicase PIF1-like [Neltuma alba]|uniref:ATP-dependent DNA helicase PIF1-like n=1 Tax=Neltuma alba TaxID=207710 RepID=UPI0010A4FA4F|nr:ATP-dependent DNA helicase PIF1-like [Prosopis alba]